MTIGTATCHFDTDDELSEYDEALIRFTLQALGVSADRIAKRIESLKSGYACDSETQCPSDTEYYS